VTEICSDRKLKSIIWPKKLRAWASSFIKKSMCVIILTEKVFYLAPKYYNNGMRNEKAEPELAFVVAGYT